MSRFPDLVSKPAREIGSYSPDSAKEATRAGTAPRMSRLDSNENPFGPSPRAIEAMRAERSWVHRYPDNDCSAMRCQLAAHHAPRPEGVPLTGAAVGEL